MVHQRGTDRRRAIQAVLRRIGLHARTSRVVEELARRGISVSADQVEEVKIDLIKAPDEIRRRISGTPRHDLRRMIRLPRKHGHRQ
ncbi:MAG: hypothetical protein IRY99_00830 [Isosphaeraceae bacterium]|nr:hypothetical protein [Isosphaeraceae bacterium]